MKKQIHGSRAKLREYILSNIGRILSAEELRIASGNVSEWARRIRELRDEEGFQILSHNDRSDLKPGEYLLETITILPAFGRNISKETRSYILDRNGFTCQMCGAVAGELHPDGSGRKTRLHIGHIVDKSKGGSDDYSNLKAICSQCNEGLANISIMRPDLTKLLIDIRRAKTDDQILVLEWLVRKFPEQSKKMVEAISIATKNEK